MINETMKEKTRRLERIIKGKNMRKTDTFVFNEVRRMLEMLLVEEREINAKICENCDKCSKAIRQRII